MFFKNDYFYCFVRLSRLNVTPMTLEQLRIFLAVAEREHVTRAAEMLHLTQSAVSGAIRALETRHDVTLFARVGRHIELTADGRAFLAQARHVLRSAEAAEQALMEMRGLARGSVAIHASQTTGTYWLPQRLAQFHAKYPGIDIRLSLGNTDQVAAAVRTGEAEIGIVEGTIDDADLLTRQIGRDELVVVVAKSHPWARLERLEPTHVIEGTWILRERGSGTRAVFEHSLARLRIQPRQLKVSLELPANEAIRAAVEAGAGATAISRAVVDYALRLKTLQAVPFIPIERPYMLVSHRERPDSRAARALIDMLEGRQERTPPRSPAAARLPH
jgi:DNA-binding transcriptional LysR family regulator